MPDIAQLVFPIRVEGNQVATVEQGDVDDVIGQVWTLCLTPPGWLTHDDTVREFGLADQAHRKGGADTALISQQISRFVPDAEAVAEQDPDALNSALALVNVRIASVA